MKLWKVYFWFMAIIVTIFFLDDIAKPNPIDMIGAAFNALTLVALYGYCFKQKIGSRKFWKIGFFASLFQEVFISAFKTKIHIQGASSSSFIYFVAVILCFLLVVPTYIAMYRYAFKGNDIWEKSMLAE